jgi:methylisocitrate lyase
MSSRTAPKVAVLKGGPSAEREVSLSSGRECAAALREAGYQVVEIDAGADLVQPISKTFRDFEGLKRFREAVGVPLSLQILGWLESDLTPDQIRQVAGLAVFPLVGLMTAARAMQDNFARLMQDLGTASLPHPVMTMPDFKTFIGFEEVV